MLRLFKFGAVTLLAATATLCAQTVPAGPGAPTPGPGCSCGAHPPGIPPQRTVTPYAGTPADLEPFGHFARPYYENYTQTNVYTGAGRLIPDPANVTEVRIGFLGPIARQADQVYGLEMLHGAQLAIDEANARGGYGGKPFRLLLHDDYTNWQFAAQPGEARPTDTTIWGAPIDAAVRMIYQDHDWAIFGSISSESTHMVLRLALKAEIPIVNSASTDPSLPETYIPWYFTDVQDDRVQAYTLARRIFTELRLRRPALLRVNSRYGRMGVPKFRDAARRLGHPVVIEQKYLPGQTDFRRELRIIQQSRADVLVTWGDQRETALILRQMRALGMTQRVFGSSLTLGPELLVQAGAAAEGFEAVVPYDPTRRDPRWLAFEQQYHARYGAEPEQFSALAYDAMNILLQSICRAGLNRARIQDALDQVYSYDGVTGPMLFDPNNKDVSPMFLATVHDGTITYRLASMTSGAPPLSPGVGDRVGETSAPPLSGAPSAPEVGAVGWLSEGHGGRSAQPPAANAGSSSDQGPCIRARLQSCRTGYKTDRALAPEKSVSSPSPYATVGEDGVTCNGPARAAMPPARATVIVFGPGAPRAASPARTAIRKNAVGQGPCIRARVYSCRNCLKMTPALAAEAKDCWPWHTVVIDTSQTGSNWGAATSALVQAISTSDILAIVALDRDSAHLAEQLSLKKFVPVLALADDRALTSANIPWIFRLPTQAGQNEALQVLAAAERRSGPNPEKLRDVLASGQDLAGVRFTSTGEPEE